MGHGVPRRDTRRVAGGARKKPVADELRQRGRGCWVTQSGGGGLGDRNFGQCIPHRYLRLHQGVHQWAVGGNTQVSAQWERGWGRRWVLVGRYTEVICLTRREEWSVRRCLALAVFASACFVQLE